MKFEDMKISEITKRALKENGFLKPTEVQERAIPISLEDRDIIVQARTGSGKTLCFLVPVMEKLEMRNEVEAIVLVPTRELAQQVENEARKLGRYHNIKTLAIYGGASIENQIRKLPSHIVVGTPGRVIDLMKRGALNLKNIKFFILDEGDRMLDMGFIDDIRWIMNKTNENKRIMLFSATMPEAIIYLARRYMKNPYKLILSKDEISAKGVRQYRISVGERNKIAKLSSLIDSEPGKYLVFCNTKIKTNRVVDLLRRFGYRAYSLNGDMPQGKRTTTMNGFKSGKINILVSTDVASRGIDVEGITHVVNYDVPLYPKDYVHRIGRTGRMGKYGKAITFVRREDEEYFDRIEALVGKKIKEINIIGNGKIKEKDDYREKANIFGMVKFRFKLNGGYSEWDIIKNAQKVGIEDYYIGNVKVSGNEGEIEIHYNFADKLKKLGIFKSLDFQNVR